MVESGTIAVNSFIRQSVGARHPQYIRNAVIDPIVKYIRLNVFRMRGTLIQKLESAFSFAVAP